MHHSCTDKTKGLDLDLEFWLSGQNLRLCDGNCCVKLISTENAEIMSNSVCKYFTIFLPLLFILKVYLDNNVATMKISKFTYKNIKYVSKTTLNINFILGQL